MSDALNKRIIQLVETGAPYAEIGERLGLSKNSISGRVKRMKDRGVVIQFPIRKKEPPKPVAKKVVTAKVKPEIQPITTSDYGGGVTLVDIPPNGCKYPTGYDNGEHLFCGEPRRDVMTAYCSHHHQIVWVKPRDWAKNKGKDDGGTRKD